MSQPLPVTVPIVTIFGGSGFIGRYIAQRMARAGWRVRVAVRRPHEAGFVRPYGVVGQVEPIQANIRDDASTRAAIAGASAVVNCVGLLGESGKQTFEAVMADGAGRIARIAAEEGVGELVHVSAIGADPESDSAYGRAKAAGEAAVTAAFPSAVILRPSVVFGDGDGFFRKFAGIARVAPLMLIPNPDTKFQPVYVDDVAAAAALAITGDVAPGVYELGGPRVARLSRLVHEMLAVIRRRRWLFAMPRSMASLQAWAGDTAQKASFGLFTNTLMTRDQLRMLAKDNVVAPDAKGFAELGIKPTPMEAVLDSYLYVYRPHGQYDAIQESAARLWN
ncbi:complex I NDUFA9 subunit family protein [Amaricoccus solimangrovi]|uniref:Complex I NDUFA9 subunit family protein n=1 Tax=Amaricoccus solimangrovi TaxID=2589815 RepID=A0A501WWJ2_9RHOB|nr:complex I NDUFA9 subunit family protein [Amaricoccus solimangrovi]TPE52615.1 complex I NDUFA9 subunit family protein [Amaricoccus solimangrovi]